MDDKKIRKRRRFLQQRAQQKPTPQFGEVILHCGHLDGEVHWLQVPFPTPFRSPSGVSGMSRWVVQCPKCLDIAGGRFEINDHFIWDEQPPIAFRPKKKK